MEKYSRICGPGDRKIYSPCSLHRTERARKQRAIPLNDMIRQSRHWPVGPDKRVGAQLIFGMCSILAISLLLVCLSPVLAYNPILNPSFEDGEYAWSSYSYVPDESVSAIIPSFGTIGLAPGIFNLLAPENVPDGMMLCGIQTQGCGGNGGVCQSFSVESGEATIDVSTRAYSTDMNFQEMDSGARVRVGLVPGYTEDRGNVLDWVTSIWSESWSTCRVKVPGPGDYTLFIEAYQPSPQAISSTLWDNIVYTALPPISVTEGPKATIPGDPENPETTAVIEWTTNVPSNSRVEYGTDTSYGHVIEDPNEVTDHRIVLSGLTRSSSYHYCAISRNEDYSFWKSDDCIFQTPIQISEIKADLADDKENIQITWVTDVPTTAQIEYGRNVEYGMSTAEATELTTLHSVKITGLEENTTYHFRIIARNAPLYTEARSSDATFRTLPDPGPVLRNSGFEDAHAGRMPCLYPWVKYDTYISDIGYHPIDGIVGPYPSDSDQRWLADISAYEGSYFVGAGANSDFEDGGVFQRITATPGQCYALSAHFATHRVGGVDRYTRLRLGIDPEGGADPSSDRIKWWSTFSPTNDSQWHCASIIAKAGNTGIITAFLDIVEQWPIEWHVVAVDDVSLNPVQSTDIGQMRSNEIGRPAVLNNKVVTYVDSRSVSYDGNTYTKAYVQEENLYAGIAVLFPYGIDQIPTVGNRVTVMGSSLALNGELVFKADNWTSDSEIHSLPKAIGVNGAGIGYGNKRVPSIANHGACNVGLRVRVFGRVSWVDCEGWPGTNVIAYIDDGSGLSDRTGYNGLRVELPGKSDYGVNCGDYIAVTGVLAVQMVDLDGWPSTGDEFPIYVVCCDDSGDWELMSPKPQ